MSPAWGDELDHCADAAASFGPRAETMLIHRNMLMKKMLMATPWNAFNLYSSYLNVVNWLYMIFPKFNS